MVFIAKAAMLLSFAYYSMTLSYAWLGQLFGAHNYIWDMFGFPPQDISPPVWFLLLGCMVAACILASLGTAYWAARAILVGGAGQDFLLLAQNLRRVGFGLIGFWLFYNIMLGGLPVLLAVSTEFEGHAHIEWDPLDIDIVFAIIGVVFLAIAQTLGRAWAAEEENKHFL